MSYSPEQIEACILAYRNGDLNYCRAGIIDLLTAYAATLRQAARVDEAAYRYEAPPWQEIAAAEGDAMAALKVLHNAGSLINAQLPGTAQLCAKWSSLIGAIKAALSAQPAERQGEAVAYITADNLALLKRDDGSAFGHMTAPIYSRARSEREIPLYLHPAAPVGVPDGTWLWCKLMDWCKARRVPPAEYNDLFAIAGEAHRLAAAPSAPQGVE